ncbi:MAG: cysteine desulfurase [Patescibacteria group bacterium]|jgi:cysteine desulfurase/selenocysteine lyase
MNTEHIKKDFPILSTSREGKELVYLDSAATTQKPKEVVEAISKFYLESNANAHRGTYYLSDQATELYEGARKKVADFIGATSADEVIFTKGATESLNFVASTWARKHIHEGDVILTTKAEHHSNLLPWMQIAKEMGAKVEYLELDDNGEITEKEIANKMRSEVKLVAVSHISNVLGTIFPVEDVCKKAHEIGAIVVVDGAQSAPHMKVDVKRLGCDFYAFSGHKMLGPTGIGVLWGRKELLEELEPYQYGGGMVGIVSESEVTWGDIPQRFEAGTQNVAGAVGLSAAIDYLNKIGIENIHEHTKELTRYTIEKLSEIPEIRMLGPKDEKKRGALVSFTLKGIHPHDLASILDEDNIAVRSGQHCTMPLHDALGIPASTRVSFYLYNTKTDIDKLILGIEKAKEILL